jgi:hypothetical protein
MEDRESAESHCQIRQLAVDVLVFACYSFKTTKNTAEKVISVGGSPMQLHTGAEHFGNVIRRGIAKRGCS